MTDPNYTAVVLVVDRSGSMASIASTVQETLEEFVNSQIAEPGRLTIDTVFFDDKIENRASFVDPSKEKLDLTLNPRGMTALFDAVGLKVQSFGEELAKLPEDKRPGKVIFVIATDGHENQSKEYTQERIAELIKHQREVYSWDFTFIGANQDAVLTAKTLNIPESSAITFAATAQGTENVLRSMSTYVAASRSGVAAAYSAEDRIAAAAGEKNVASNGPVPRSSGVTGSTMGAPRGAKPAEKKPRTRKTTPKKDEKK